MGVWIRDGFEFYTNTGDAIIGSGYGVWASGAGLPHLSTNTRFGVGQSVQSGTSAGRPYVGSALQSNQGTVFAANAYAWGTALGTASPRIGITFYDAGVAQCTICYMGDGSIVLKRGADNGTVIATYSGAYLGSQWNQFQHKIVFSGTVGEWHVRKNGNTADDFSATGLNNIATANAYANTVGISGGGSAQQNDFIDDFAAWDTTGSAPWNNWIGDFRASQQMPIANVSTQFSNQAAGLSTNFGFTTNTGSAAQAQNVIHLWPFTPAVGGSLAANLTFELASNLTGNVRFALYDGDGDVSTLPTTGAAPGTLLYQTNPINNPVTGVNTVAWTSTPAVQGGRQYWLAALSDASCTFKDNGVNAVGKWSYGFTYGAFPASLAGLGATGANRFSTIYSTITVTNFGAVNENYQNNGASYIFDSVSGHQDLYNIATLEFTPSAVLGLDIVGLAAKSDAGLRQINYILKSGAATVTEPAVTLNTSFNWNRYQQDTDPNTSAAWTPTAINNLQLGVGVV